MELNLLEKTELKIYGLKLQNVNLGEIAKAAAAVLGLPVREVLVVDVRHDHICLDILAKSISMRQIIGKEQALLTELAAIDGLELTPETYIDSAGIMGLIGCDESQAGVIAAQAEAVADEIARAVLGRALVYATGFEVQNGMIKDTNSPYLLELLQANGYKAEFGGILADDASIITHKLRDAAERGFGLVITTGGVGAEDKDFSVEALLKLDPAAATPWIVKFAIGTGRHVKEGVRIAVGQSGLTTFISLPGPHDEVVAAGAALQNRCQAHEPIAKEALAGEVAQILRDKLRHKHWHGQPH